MLHVVVKLPDDMNNPSTAPKPAPTTKLSSINNCIAYQAIGIPDIAAAISGIPIQR